MSTNILEQLAFPFHPSLIYWKPGSLNKERTKALAMPYATLRAYQDRLDEVCGLEWAVSYTPWGDKIICHLTMAGVTRSSTGEPDEQAERAEFAGTAAEAQAFKRACSMFTLGRYLYHLPTLWMEYDVNLKQFTDYAKASLSGVIAQNYTRAMGEQNRKRKAEDHERQSNQPVEQTQLEPTTDPKQTLPVSAADQSQAADPGQSGGQPINQTTSENVNCALAMSALNAKGAVVFAKHWESAKAWLAERFTTKTTPDNVRHSLLDLASAELEALLTGLAANQNYYVTEWHKHRKASAKAMPKAAPATPASHA